MDIKKTVENLTKAEAQAFIDAIIKKYSITTPKYYFDNYFNTGERGTSKRMYNYNMLKDEIPSFTFVSTTTKGELKKYPYLKSIK